MFNFDVTRQFLLLICRPLQPKRQPALAVSIAFLCRSFPHAYQCAEKDTADATTIAKYFHFRFFPFP